MLFLSLLGVGPNRYHYFVDTVRGSDANPGSLTRPFASFAPIVSAGAAGKRIGVMGGSVFRTSVTLTGDDIKVVGRPIGDGAKPLFDDSKTIAAWTPHATLANRWQATLTLPGNIKILGNAWLNDDFIAQTTSEAATSAATPLYVSGWTATSATATYYSTVDPNTLIAAGSVFTHSYSHGLFIDGDRPSVIGIRTRRNGHQDGSLRLTGEDIYAEDCDVEDGCRHAMIAGAGAEFVRTRFYRARNDLEAGQSANLLVVNQSEVESEGYTTTDCIFDGGDQPNVSALSNHGSPDTDRFASITHSGDTFINCKQCGDAHADEQLMENCTFTNCAQGPFVGTGGVSLIIRTCSGSLDQVFKNDAAANVTITCEGNTWEPTTLGTGLYRADSTASGNTYNFVNETIHTDGATSGTGDLIRIAAGTVNRSGMNVGPNLFGLKLLHIMRLGFNGGTVTLTSNNNHDPFGRDYIVNGTTYATFSAYQAGTGQDAASATDGTGGVGGSSAIFFSDDFTRANQNLEASTDWTRQTGTQSTAAAATVSSNQLALVGTNRTAYAAPDTGQADHWAEIELGTIPGTPGPFPVAVRIVDSDNFLAFRCSASQGQVWKCVSGTLNQIGTVTATFSTGDKVRLLAEGTAVTLYHKDAVTSINGLAYAASALDSATKNGIAARASALSPAADNFRSGRRT